MSKQTQSEQSNSRVDTDDGGWWPPGEGEPGQDWDYERCVLRLFNAGDNIDVVQVLPEGERGLVSIPLDAIAECLARGRRS